MKLTKRQLRRIIREEKEKIAESSRVSFFKGSRSRSATEILADLHEALDELIGAIGFQEAADELRGISEELYGEAQRYEEEGR